MTDKTLDDLPRGLELTSLSETFRDDPFAVLNRMREESPVFEDGQLRDHVVFDAKRVHKILSDKNLLVDPRSMAPTSTRMMRGEDLTVETSLLHADGDRHRRLRSLIMKALSKKRIDGFRDRAREICEGLLDAVADQESFDFVEKIARPMPTIVITELLGVDKSQHEDFKIWSDRVIAHALNPLASEETHRLGLEAMAEIEKTIEDEVNRRLKAGDRPDDLISAMMEARTADGNSLSTPEISQQAQLLLIAGNQTTTDLMGSLVKNLLEEDDSYAQIVADTSLISDAIEEVLRYEPPIFGTERITPEELDIDGVKVPKGHVVTAMLTSANRDPELNENPNEFDIHRKGQHLSFGGGVHRCIGAPLAKMENEVLLEILAARLPNLRPSDRPKVYSMNPGFRSLDSYWVQPN